MFSRHSRRISQVNVHPSSLVKYSPQFFHNNALFHACPAALLPNPTHNKKNLFPAGQPSKHNTSHPPHSRKRPQFSNRKPWRMNVEGTDNGRSRPRHSSTDTRHFRSSSAPPFRPHHDSNDSRKPRRSNQGPGKDRPRSSFNDNNRPFRSSSPQPWRKNGDRPTSKYTPNTRSSLSMKSRGRPEPNAAVVDSHKSSTKDSKFPKKPYPLSNKATKTLDQDRTGKNPLVNYKEIPTWRDRLAKKLETQSTSDRAPAPLKLENPFLKRSHSRSTVNELQNDVIPSKRLPKQQLEKQSRSHVNTTSVKLEPSFPRRANKRVEPETSPSKPFIPKRFADPYLLVGRIDRLIKKDMLYLCLEDIRNSPLANKSPQVWNRILRYYANKGYFKLALSLLLEMKKRGAIPDNHSWHYLFSALAASQLTLENKKAQAMHLFDEAKSGKNLSAHVLNAYLKSLISAGELQLLEEFLTSAPNHLALDCATLTIILNAIMHSKKPDECQSTLDLVIAKIPSVGLDSDLLAALCGATAKSPSGNCAIPIHYLSQLAPKLNLDSFKNEFIDLNVPQITARPTAPVLPLSTKAANWILIMAQRLDKARVPRDAQRPLLLEHLYGQFQSSTVSGELDSFSMDILFSGMERLGRCGALVKLYFEAFHPDLDPIPVQDTSPVKLPVNGPDPSQASFSSLLHASKSVLSELKRPANRVGEPLPRPLKPVIQLFSSPDPAEEPNQSPPYIMHLLSHYELVTKGKPMSAMEYYSVAHLGSSLVGQGRSLGKAAWNAPVDGSMMARVLGHLLSVLGIRPGSPVSDKVHKLPATALWQCISLVNYAHVSRMPVPDARVWSPEMDDVYVDRVRDLKRILNREA